MTREEKIQRAIRSGQLIPFEEWYDLNKDAFELAKNPFSPYEIYEEYVREVLGE